ncbi:K(+)-transporting ATPase subunit F [Erysipelothrix sp. HDW6C]|nr:K(+)-transporting ATPase subunit F [Erysipelothrix sp. HDW6C]
MGDVLMILLLVAIIGALFAYLIYALIYPEQF